MDYEQALTRLVEIAATIQSYDKALGDELAVIIVALSAKLEAENDTQHIPPDPDDKWDDVWAMIDDMKLYAANNGRAIICADRPAQLRIGYCCSNTGKTWSIRIADLKKCLTKDEEIPSTQIRANIMRRAIMSQEGKQNLVDVINGK